MPKVSDLGAFQCWYYFRIFVGLHNVHNIIHSTPSDPVWRIPLKSTLWRPFRSMACCQACHTPQSTLSSVSSTSTITIIQRRRMQLASRHYYGFPGLMCWSCSVQSYLDWYRPYKAISNSILRSLIYKMPRFRAQPNFSTIRLISACARNLALGDMDLLLQWNRWMTTSNYWDGRICALRVGLGAGGDECVHAYSLGWAIKCRQ